MLIRMKPNKGHVIFDGIVQEEDERCYIVKVTKCEDRPHIVGIVTSICKDYFEEIYSSPAVDLFMSN